MQKLEQELRTTQAILSAGGSKVKQIEDLQKTIDKANILISSKEKDVKKVEAELVNVAGIVTKKEEAVAQKEHEIVYQLLLILIGSPEVAIRYFEEEVD